MDIRLPSDFPRNPDLSFFRRVETRAQQDGYPDDWQGHFIGSWKAVAYRFKACDQHSRSFTRSIEKVGSAPLETHQYRQDADLFGFFVNGLAALESLSYCLFALGSRLRLEDFQFTTDKDIRKVGLSWAASVFAKAYPRDPLSAALKRILAMPNYDEWSNIRNVLAHRVTPGRTLYMRTISRDNNPTPAPPDEWRVSDLRIPLTDQTTASRRFWPVSSLADVLTNSDDFATHYC